MTPEKMALFEIRDVIEQLPQQDQAKIQEFAALFRNLLKDECYATMAFALVGAEMAAK